LCERAKTSRLDFIFRTKQSAMRETPFFWCIPYLKG
jgi:hypothetical protein